MYNFLWSRLGAENGKLPTKAMQETKGKKPSATCKPNAESMPAGCTGDNNSIGHSARSSIDTIELIKNKIAATSAIGRFDSKIYKEYFGEKVYNLIRNTAPYMPDCDNSNYKIHASLNVAYDKGFQDACKMVLACIIENYIDDSAEEHIEVKPQ